MHSDGKLDVRWSAHELECYSRVLGVIYVLLVRNQRTPSLITTTEVDKEERERKREREI